MWIGIDDTDGPSGGCTTHLLTEIVRVAAELGDDLIGYPGLVRLNPNIPWKTRGNAALSARFGCGLGRSRIVGELGGRPVRAYARGRPLGAGEERRLFDATCAAVDRHARREPGTDPAVVAHRRRLPSALYWEAVARRVDVHRVVQLLQARGARYWVRGAPPGLVGAAAAISWPGHHPTFELLAYRRPEAIGTPRAIDPASVESVVQRYPELFQCIDPRTRRLLIAPHTACPILFGLRATRPGRLVRAALRLGTEPIDRWMLFATNQGTGDHLARRTVAELRPFDAARLTAIVRAPPRIRPGGHVELLLADRTGEELTAWAFEPTKTLPPVARRLVAGDTVELWGGRGGDPAFRLEGIRVLHLVPRRARLPARPCPRCGRTVRSAGTGRGYRCRGCRARLPPEHVELSASTPRELLGEHLPTPSARRHLAAVGAPRRPGDTARWASGSDL